MIIAGAVFVRVVRERRKRFVGKHRQLSTYVPATKRLGVTALCVSIVDKRQKIGGQRSDM